MPAMVRYTGGLGIIRQDCGGQNGEYGEEKGHDCEAHYVFTFSASKPQDMFLKESGVAKSGRSDHKGQPAGD